MDIIKTLMRLKKASIAEIAKEIKEDYMKTYRAIKNLEAFGIIIRTDDGYKLNELISSGLMNLSSKYNINAILNLKFLNVLFNLLHPKKIPDLVMETDVSEKTVRNIIDELASLGIIEKTREGWVVKDDPILRAIIMMLSQKVLQVEEIAEIVYAGKGIIIKKCPKDYRCSGVLTAFSRYPDYDFDIDLAFHYYLIPENKVEIEDVFIHSLLVAKTKYERTLAALFYAKNKSRMRESQLIHLCEKFGLLRLLARIENYLIAREFDEFLPRIEMKELAEKYRIDLSKFEAKSFKEVFFEGLSNVLNRNLEALLIGGGAMVLKGYKDATLDIDLIVKNREDAENLMEALKNFGYRVISNKEFIVLQNEGPRVDIHIGKIDYKFVLTDSVLKRANVRDYGKLKLYIASDIDLLIMKSVTERVRDLEDVLIIIKKGKINWKTLVEAVEEQDKILDRPISYSVLVAIEEAEKALGIKVKYKRKLTSIALRSFIKFLYYKRGIKSVREIAKMMKRPEMTIRKILKELEANSKLSINS